MSDAGHDPLLSKEEADALLAAMREGGDAAPAEPVDLASPGRALRDALGRADRAANTLSRGLGKVFLRVLGSSASSEDEPAEVTPASVFTASLAPGSAIARIASREGSESFLVIGPTLVSFALDRRLGAPLSLEGGESSALATSAATPAPVLSMVDRRILRPFFEALVDAFNKVWGGGDDAFRVLDVLARLEDLPVLPAHAPLLRIALRALPVGGASGAIVLALTSEAVSDTTPRATEAEQAPSRASDDDRRRMRACLAKTEVECTSILGATKSSIRELLRLEVGDVLRLDTVPGQPIALVTGDIVVARGLPVVHHGNLALEITEAR